MDIRERIEQICIDYTNDEGQVSQEGFRELIDLLLNHQDAVIDTLKLLGEKEKSTVKLVMAYLLRSRRLRCPERRQFFFEAVQEADADGESRADYFGILIVLLETDYDETIAAALTPYFYDEMPRVRSLMCTFSRHTKARRAIPHLISLLDDGEREVVFHAHTALEELDFPEAKAGLREWEDRNGKPDFRGIFK